MFGSDVGIIFRISLLNLEEHFNYMYTDQIVFRNLLAKFDIVNRDQNKFDINNEFDRDKIVDQRFEVVIVESFVLSFSSMDNLIEDVMNVEVIFVAFLNIWMVYTEYN